VQLLWQRPNAAARTIQDLAIFRDDRRVVCVISENAEASNAVIMRTRLQVSTESSEQDRNSYIDTLLLTAVANGYAHFYSRSLRFSNRK